MSKLKNNNLNQTFKVYDFPKRGAEDLTVSYSLKVLAITIILYTSPVRKEK